MPGTARVARGRRRAGPAATTLALLGATLAAGGCEEPAPPPLVRVGHSLHDHHAPLFVAAANPGWFARGGLYLREVRPQAEYELVAGESVLARVVVDSSTGGEQIIRKLVEGGFDMVFGGVPAMIVQIDRGAPIRIVAPVMTEGAALVVAPSFPARDWEQFATRLRAGGEPVRIGYKIGLSVQNLIFESSLRAEGITFARGLDEGDVSVQLVDLKGLQNLLPALEAGIVDGFIANQPLPARAEHEGVGKVIANLSDLPPSGRWRSNPCCAIAASTAFLERQPRAAEAFLTLMLRAGRFVSERPEEAAPQIARWLGLPEEVERASLSTMSFVSDFDESWERGVENWVRSMIEGGELTGEVRAAFESGAGIERVYARELFAVARRKM